MIRPTHVLPAMLALAAVCFSAAPVEAQRRDQRVITREELAERTDLVTAYDAVRLLRPNWLRRGSVSRMQDPGAPSADNSGVLIFVDEMEWPGLTDLRNLPAAQVLEMRYLDRSQASTRFGRDIGPSIVITTTRSRQP